VSGHPGLVQPLAGLARLVGCQSATRVRAGQNVLVRIARLSPSVGFRRYRCSLLEGAVLARHVGHSRSLSILHRPKALGHAWEHLGLSNTTEPQNADLLYTNIGFLNLLGERGRGLLESDNAALAPLFFFDSVTSSAAYPSCGILFVYGTVDDAGKLVGTTDTIAGLAKACGARLVVLASDNDSKALNATSRDEWKTNIVFTVNRNGPTFAPFFEKLFRLMSAGSNFARAFLTLAPNQGPGGPAQHDVPGTLVIVGVPNLVLGTTSRLPNARTVDFLAARKTTVARLTEFLAAAARADGTWGPETLLSLAGSLVGFAAQNAALCEGAKATRLVGAVPKNSIVALGLKSGERLLSGDWINLYLYPEGGNQFSLYGILAARVVAAGLAPKDLPDYRELAGYISGTIGSENFGVVRLANGRPPSLSPRGAIERLWPGIETVLHTLSRGATIDPPSGPVQWPLLLSLVVANLTSGLTKYFDPRTAFSVVMESAIIASKLSPEDLFPGNWLIAAKDGRLAISRPN
jgi:hypothetical protein